MINITAVVEELQRRYEGVAEVTAVEVKKSYGLRTGICIKELGSVVAPNIYTDCEPFEGIDDLDQLCDLVQKVYEENKTPNLNLDWINDIEEVKSRIKPRLVNQRFCAEGYLADKPHREFADLAIAYVIDISPEDNGAMTAMVTDDMIKMWDVTESDLYNMASVNVCPVITDMADIMAKRFINLGFDDMPAELIAPKDSMFVLNSEGNEPQGAAVLPFYMEELKERFGRFVALPSSIHEWIIIPTDKDCFTPDTDMLTDMVQEVNATAVDLEDRLADHSYYWNGTEFVV